MGYEINPAVWGLLGTLVGAAASIGTTWLVNSHTSKLEDQRSRDSRGEVARAFQRQTLIEMQDAIYLLIRKAQEIHLADEMAFRKTSQWGRNLLDDELLTSMMEMFRKVAILNERISDAELRDAVSKLSESLSYSTDEDDRERAKSNLVSASADFVLLTAKLGKVLRSHYEPI